MMSDIKLNVPESALLPENDLQELWQLNGRTAALHDFLMMEMADSSSTNPCIYAKEICAIMGWKYER